MSHRFKKFIIFRNQKVLDSLQIHIFHTKIRFVILKNFNLSFGMDRKTE